MRLTIGLTKKLGLPGYSSVGASCQIESSEFSGKLNDEAFRRRVERAFEACRSAVEEELLRHHPATGDAGSSEPIALQEPLATPNQLQALRTLTKRLRLAEQDLDGLFGGRPLESLSKSAASTAITRLRRGPTAAGDAGAVAAKNGFHEGGT